MGTFYFLIGIPGSGKSHFAKRLAEETGAVVVCPDCIRVNRRVHSERAFEIAREEIGKNLKIGRDVIFDATNTIRKWRRDNILAGKPFAERVVCCVMDTPLGWCLERHKRRVTQGKKVELPESTIIRMDDQLGNNPPGLSEGFDKIRIYSGIGIKALDGLFAGEARQVFLDQVDPMSLLDSMVQHGWHWELDYSHATSEETYAFFKADIRCRAKLAEKEGRPIFLDEIIFKRAEELGRALKALGKKVVSDRDDKFGFRVKSVGPEPTKH